MSSKKKSTSKKRVDEDHSPIGTSEEVPSPSSEVRTRSRSASRSDISESSSSSSSSVATLVASAVCYPHRIIIMLIVSNNTSIHW